MNKQVGNNAAVFAAIMGACLASHALADVSVSGTPGTDYKGAAISVSGDGPGTVVINDYDGGAQVFSKEVTGAEDFFVDGLLPDGVYNVTATYGASSASYRLYQGERGYSPEAWFVEAATNPTAARWTAGTAPTVVDSRFVFSGDADTPKAYTPTGSQSDRLAVVDVDVMFYGVADVGDLPTLADMQAAITVVADGNVCKFAYFANGSWTVSTVVAEDIATEVYAVRTTLDRMNKTVCYEVKTGDAPFTVVFNGSSSSVGEGLGSVAFAGDGSLGTVAGDNSVDKADAWLCQVGGTKYKSLNDEDVKAATSPVTLLWDASWNVDGEATCSVGGNYSLLVTGGKIGCAALPAETTLAGGKYKSGTPGWTLASGYSCVGLAVADGAYTHEIVPGVDYPSGTKVYPSSGGDIAFVQSDLVSAGVIDGTESTQQEIADKMNATAANGNPKWENVVLGLRNDVASDIPVVMPVQTASASGVTLELGHVKVNPNTSADVTYEVYVSGTPGGTKTRVTDAVAYNEPTTVDLPLEGVKYYTIKVTAEGAH